MNSPADNIRAALKTAGFKSRQVTVKMPHYGSVTVTIRDASVRLDAVKAVAMPFERISRCEASGEILSGGNTFVRVEYLDAIVKPLASVIEKLLAESAGHVVSVGPLRMSADACHWDEKVWKHDGNAGHFYCTGFSHGAYRLAVELLNLGATL